jgi:hypothetical protein
MLKSIRVQQNRPKPLKKVDISSDISSGFEPSRCPTELFAFSAAILLYCTKNKVKRATQHHTIIKSGRIALNDIYYGHNNYTDFCQR